MNNIYKANQNSSFIIEFDYFNGPLNVLLDILSKRRELIYEIRINDIIKEFFNYISKNDNNKLEELSGFIYIVSIMLDMKSKSLIPSRNEEAKKSDENTNEDIEILKQREKHYRAFQEVSNYFSELIENEEIYYIREAPVEEHFFDFFNEIIKKIKVQDLHRIASRILSTKEERLNIPEFYNKKITRNIFQEIKRIKGVLESKDNISFKELTSGYGDMMDIVISFLSILELYKSEEIDIVQFETFGEIIIKKMAA